MNLTVDEINGFMVEAHELATRPDGSFSARAAAGFLLDLIEDAEGIDPAAVEAYRYTLARAGAQKACADWRRTHRVTTTTGKGVEVELPRYAGVRRVDDEGTFEHVQLSLPGMTLDELKAHREKLGRQRDTLSIEVSALDNLISVMESKGYDLVSEALEHLAGVA